MKKFYSEYEKNYATYTFGYAAYAIAEAGDRLTDLYMQGYLPYTGASEYLPERQAREIYYMARSLRVGTQPFHLTSELRRITRKATPYEIVMTWHDKADYMDDADLLAFCTTYAAERYKVGDMTAERLDYLFSRDCLTHVVRFMHGDELLGYVFVGLDDVSVHYWYSFYRTDWLDRLPLGKYMMLCLGEWAASEGRSHLYLGTCYGEVSLYKVRDFKGVSYYDGMGWSDDVPRLKQWCKADEEAMDADRMKSLE